MKWQRTATLFLLLLFALLSSACGNAGQNNTSQGNANAASAGGTSTPRTAKPQSQFEQDLQYVRDGQFNYILVFTRKDSAAFTPEDISYLKANSPRETNQWVKTDEGRRVIAGSNFEFTVENLEALNKRFNVEDYSGR